MDGLGNVAHERLFAIEIAEGEAPRLEDPTVLGNLLPDSAPDPLPAVALLPPPEQWIHEHVLQPFLEEVRKEREAEVDRVAAHVDLS